MANFQLKEEQMWLWWFVYQYWWLGDMENVVRKIIMYLENTTFFLFSKGNNKLYLRQPSYNFFNKFFRKKNID